MSGIFLIGITLKPSHKEDKILPSIRDYNLSVVAVGIFYIRSNTCFKQWFSSGSIFFSDNQVAH